MGEKNAENLKMMEEKMSKVIQLWREGQAGYQEVKPLVTSVWQLYLSLLNEDMERAVRDSLGQRIWQKFHYPVIEVMRKQGQPLSRVSQRQRVLRHPHLW